MIGWWMVDDYKKKEKNSSLSLSNISLNKTSGLSFVLMNYGVFERRVVKHMIMDGGGGNTYK